MITLIALSLAGTVLAAVIGTLWYMPGTPMGKIHMQYLGFNTLSPEEQKQKMEEAKPKMPMMYVAQMALSLLTSYAVVTIITMTVQNGVSLQMAFGFVLLNWFCFMVPVVGSSILWSNCDRTLAWKKFFSDILSHLVTVLAIALMTSFFV